MNSSILLGDQTMSDCLHCDINELVQSRIDKGDVDIAQMAVLVAESLADLIQLAPETEQSKIIADALAHFGLSFLEGDDENEGSARH
jgi:hypothetical protein